MKAPPSFGLLALAVALLLAGCGGGAASQRTSTPRTGEMATATQMPGTAAGASPSLPAATVSPPLAAPGQTPSHSPSAVSSTVATGAPATMVAAIGWAPASTTPCQPEGEQVGNRTFASPEQYARNLRCAVNLFGWPPGRYPDLDVIIQRWFDQATQEGGASFEVGLEFTQLTGFNKCAWYLTWLEARQNGDAATEAAALDVMINIIPNYLTVIPGIPVIYDPGIANLVRDEVTRASLGDPSLVQRVVDGCQRVIPWKDGP